MTLQGSGTIGLPSAMVDGTLWMLRVQFSASQTAILYFDPAVYTMQMLEYGPGMGGGALLWLFMYADGKCHMIREWGVRAGCSSASQHVT